MSGWGDNQFIPPSSCCYQVSNCICPILAVKEYLNILVHEFVAFWTVICTVCVEMVARLNQFCRYEQVYNFSDIARLGPSVIKYIQLTTGSFVQVNGNLCRFVVLPVMAVRWKQIVRPVGLEHYSEYLFVAPPDTDYLLQRVSDRLSTKSCCCYALSELPPYAVILLKRKLFHLPWNRTPSPRQVGDVSPMTVKKPNSLTAIKFRYNTFVWLKSQRVKLFSAPWKWQ